jgi:dsRNA-specific ribonuclease
VALGEYAQKNKLSSPSYMFRMDGLSHVPNITCSCSFNQKTGVGSASKKQEAKRQAAKDLVRQLLEENNQC